MPYRTRRPRLAAFLINRLEASTETLTERGWSAAIALFLINRLEASTETRDRRAAARKAAFLINRLEASTETVLADVTIERIRGS